MEAVSGFAVEPCLPPSGEVSAKLTEGVHLP